MGMFICIIGFIATLIAIMLAFTGRSEWVYFTVGGLLIVTLGLMTTALASRR